MPGKDMLPAEEKGSKEMHLKSGEEWGESGDARPDQTYNIRGVCDQAEERSDEFNKERKTMNLIMAQG